MGAILIAEIGKIRTHKCAKELLVPTSRFSSFIDSLTYLSEDNHFTNPVGVTCISLIRSNNFSSKLIYF